MIGFFIGRGRGERLDAYTEGGAVVISGDNGVDTAALSLTPAEARELGEWLIAAADEVEGTC